ncbi:MAG TPA: PaaI family thioesterase [Micropepsaceae bacterium]|nr:PaaI family thioesterase [Micropepsaceae bacterium]
MAGLVEIAGTPAEALPPSIQATLKRQAPAATMLGQKIIAIDAEKGAARIAYDAGENLQNRFGALHGGMIAAIMDDVMAIAAGLSLQWGEISPTLEMKTSFLAMAKPGRLMAEAAVLRRGKSVIFIEGRLEDADGRLIATASATASVTPMKK